MADKVVEQTDNEVVEQIKDKKEESPVVEECKSKNGDTNTPKSAEKETNGVPEKDTVEEETNGDEVEKVCSAKRKSAAGDAPEDTPVEGATPEKKQKLDDSKKEEESKTETEVTA